MSTLKKSTAMGIGGTVLLIGAFVLHMNVVPKVSGGNMAPYYAYNKPTQDTVRKTVTVAIPELDKDVQTLIKRTNGAGKTQAEEHELNLLWQKQFLVGMSRWRFTRMQLDSMTYLFKSQSLVINRMSLKQDSLLTESRQNDRDTRKAREESDNIRTLWSMITIFVIICALGVLGWIWYLISKLSPKQRVQLDKLMAA
jgi:hypothetical protein